MVGSKLQFPTSEEAAYPWLFCERLVNLVEQLAIDKGCTSATNLAEQLQQSPMTNFQRYVFDALPRSSKLKPLVAEFGRYFFCSHQSTERTICTNDVETIPERDKTGVSTALDMGEFSGRDG